MWNFHIGDSQGHHTCNMILGCNILSKLNIDSCFSDNSTRVNVGVYKGCTAPMRELKKYQCVIRLAYR